MNKARKPLCIVLLLVGAGGNCCAASNDVSPDALSLSASPTQIGANASMRAVDSSASTAMDDQTAFDPMQSVSAQDMQSIMQMDDSAAFGMIKVDTLEHALRPGDAFAWQIESWYGTDANKLVMRSEGEHDDGATSAHIDVLYDRPVASYWDLQAGLRHDFSAAGQRAVNWLAFGMQGLAPYWIEVEATAYASDRGWLAARLRLQYDLNVTQRLILQSELEWNGYALGGDAQPRDTLSESGAFGGTQVALRLRYEIQREFAPYIGVIWQRGRDAVTSPVAMHVDVSPLALVAGVRVWF